MAAVKVDQEVITAVYKVNLHCQKCAYDIKKPLLTTQGVHGVEFNVEKNEIKVKGVIDVTNTHKVIEKLSKKKVELISPQVKVKESTEKKVVVKETKAPILHLTTIKVHLHCDQCEKDLRKKLLKHKGIYTVKTDLKALTVTVHGTIEPDKLLAYMRKKVHKSAEIIKTEKKEEKKVEEKKEKEKVEVKSVEKTDIVEFKTEKKVEAKTKEGNVPYFVHYVYAPQLFSDENPNACAIM